MSSLVSIIGILGMAAAALVVLMAVLLVTTMLVIRQGARRQARAVRARATHRLVLEKATRRPERRERRHG